MPSSFLIHQILGENSACFINMHLPLTRVCGTHPYEGEDVCFWNTQYQTCIFPHKGVYPTHVGYTPLWGGKCMFLKHAISSQNLGTVCSCKRVTPAIERKWKKQIREKQEWTAWCAWHAYLYSFKQGRLYSPMTCIFIFF